MKKFQCLVCGAGRTYAGDGVRVCTSLREKGWQVSAAHDEAVCPDCVRDIHEDMEESPANSGFLTWRQLRDVARVSGDEHTHEPELETGNVPGIVRHLASMLEQPLATPQKQAANAGLKRVEVACQCDEEAPNHHGGYGVCPKHGDFGDHLLVGDSVGPFPAVTCC